VELSHRSSHYTPIAMFMLSCSVIQYVGFSVYGTAIRDGKYLLHLYLAIHCSC